MRDICLAASPLSKHLLSCFLPHRGGASGRCATPLLSPSPSNLRFQDERSQSVLDFTSEVEFEALAADLETVPLSSVAAEIRCVYLPLSTPRMFSPALIRRLPLIIAYLRSES